MARAGRKDRRIQIQTLTSGKDTFGGNTQVWDLARTVAAEVTYPDTTGTEQYSADQLSTDLVALFRVDYIAGISPRTHRIVYERRIYDILSSVEVGRRESLKITARTRGL